FGEQETRQVPGYQVLPISPCRGGLSGSFLRIGECRRDRVVAGFSRPCPRPRGPGGTYASDPETEPAFRPLLERQLLLLSRTLMLLSSSWHCRPFPEYFL